MPIYEYACPSHGKFTGWANMSARHDPQACGKCDVLSPFVISAPRVFGDFTPYISPATGELIEGKRQRAEDFAKSNCRPYETGELQDLETRQKLADIQETVAIEEAVEKTLVEMKND